MEFTHSRTVKIIAIFLLLAAILQPIYTFLYLKAPGVDRQFIWGIEALLFVLLSAFAGAALVQTKRHALAFSAIAFSAVLNVIQVGIGLTQFGPVREAVKLNAESGSADLGSIASSVISFSFFGYNAAKILLGLAAILFGLTLFKSAKTLSKSLGGLAVLVGVLAFVTNSVLMMFGLQADIIPRQLAGGSGVVATLLLALCLFSLPFEEAA